MQPGCLQASKAWTDWKDLRALSDELGLLESLCDSVNHCSSPRGGTQREQWGLSARNSSWLLGIFPQEGGCWWWTGARSIAWESGAEHAGGGSLSHTVGVDKPRGCCIVLLTPPWGSLSSTNFRCLCRGSSVCTGHCGFPISGCIYLSPSGRFRV